MGFNFFISFLFETLFWPLIFINLCLMCVRARAYMWSACYCGSVLTKTGFFSAHTIKLPQHQIVGNFIRWFLSSQTSVTAIGALLHLSNMNMPKVGNLNHLVTMHRVSLGEWNVRICSVTLNIATQVWFSPYKGEKVFFILCVIPSIHKYVHAPI